MSRDDCVLDEQRNKQPFPVGPDGTIFFNFYPNCIKLRAIFVKNFAVLLVKNHGFLAPRLGIRGI